MEFTQPGSITRLLRRKMGLHLGTHGKGCFWYRGSARMVGPEAIPELCTVGGEKGADSTHWQACIRPHTQSCLGTGRESRCRCFQAMGRRAADRSSETRILRGTTRPVQGPAPRNNQGTKAVGKGVSTTSLFLTTGLLLLSRSLRSG